MAERYGSFKNLSNGKKPITAEEAWIMLKELGLLGQEFVPGATSLRKLMEGDVKGAGSELNDWIPGGKAVQNLIEGKDQDWAKNALDLAIVGKPLVKGAKKAAEAIERMPKGGKEGFLRLKKAVGKNTLEDIIEASNEAGQKITPKIEQEIRNYINMYENGKSSTLLQLGTYDAMSPEAKQVVDAYMSQPYVATPKPKDFDTWTAKKRKEYFDNNFFIPEGKSPILSEKMARNKKDETYGLGHGDYGVIYPDKLTIDDYIKAIDDREPELAAARKVEELKRAAQKEKNARKQAEKEAKWKAEREAAAKRAEISRLAKEAEEKRLAEEAEKQRLAEEAEAKLAEEKRLVEEAEQKAQEEEFERQFREEEAYERNRYADSVGTALGREAAERDIDNWLFDKLAEAENEPQPISITQVMGESYNKSPTPASSVTNNKRQNNTYDHSRRFLDTEFKQVPAIDRSGNKYTDPHDTKYDIYETWKNVIDKPNYDKHPVLKRLAESKTIEDLDKTRNWYGKVSKNGRYLGNDPYYSAGIIGDENVKLWDLINKYRSSGKTDEEIRKILKNSLDNYQGKLDRYKARMEARGGQFDYDGASTNPFIRTPSERAAAYNALGIDTPEYEKLQEMRDFYKGITKRVFDYENRFPQTPKLTSNQFKQLKDMGIKPEEIDQYLAEHPEFLLAVE